MTQIQKTALMMEKLVRKFIHAPYLKKDYIPPMRGEGELSDVQAEAILNMRLRSLRRLEEI